MERDCQRNNAGNANANTNTDNTNSESYGGLLLRSSLDTNKTTSSDFVLQWGNRKRLRCMKVQVKDDSTAPVNRTTVRVDRRVVRADEDPSSNQPSNTNNHHHHNNNNNHSNGYFNLRRRPSPPPSSSSLPPQRVLRGLF